MEIVARRNLERAIQLALAMSTWSFLLRVVGERPDSGESLAARAA
jgi:hypothetical protein